MLKSRMTKVATVVVAATMIVGLAVLPSFAAADTAAVSAVSDAASGLKDTLVAVAVAVLPYAAAIVAIGVGWRLARRFVKA